MVPQKPPFRFPFVFLTIRRQSGATATRDPVDDIQAAAALSRKHS